MAITSKEINLDQLDKELGGKGLIADFNDDKKKLILPADSSDLTENELEAGIAAHVAQPTESDAKAAQKQALLDRLGITAEEAQLLLGGN
jgi:hypothetical protein